MKIRSLSPWLLVSGVVLALFYGCSGELDDSGFLGTIKERAPVEKSFKDWCLENRLEKCEALPSSNVSLENWRFSVDLFGVVLNSPTKITFLRQDFEFDSVKKLFEAFSLSNVLATVDGIAWSQLDIGREKISLKNEAPLVFSRNKLSWHASDLVTVTMGENRILNILGLLVSTPSNSSPIALQQISLDRPDNISFLLPKERVSAVPLSFLISPIERDSERSPLIVKAKAISNLLLDESLDWRSKLYVVLTQRDLAKISDYIIIDPATNSAMSQLLKTLLFEGSSFVFGGKSNLLGGVSLKQPLKCQMIMYNIPVIGSMKITLDFGKGFGLESIERTNEDEAKAKVYGINTSMGKVHSLEIVGDQLKMNVGNFSIPISEESQKDSNSKFLGCEKVTSRYNQDQLDIK